MKSIASIIFALFGISVIYYLSFWTEFDINIFQYIAVEDIIKGVAYPLRYAGVWFLGIIGFFVILSSIIYSLDEDITATSKKKWGVQILWIVTLSIGFLYTRLPSNGIVGMIFSIIFSVLIFILYSELEIGEKIRINQPNERYFNIFYEKFSVYVISFLVINSLISGKIESNKILKGIEYNYVMKGDFGDNIKVKGPYLIFIGAISDRYVFIDKSGFEKLIVDKSELPHLRFHHYDISSASSVQHMENMLEIVD